MGRIRDDEQEKRLRLALRRRRQEIGMKQGELARKMGKARNFVSKYERGERGLSFSETLELCCRLGIREQVLVDAMYRDDIKGCPPLGAPSGKAAKLDAASQGECASGEREPGGLPKRE